VHSFRSSTRWYDVTKAPNPLYKVLKYKLLRGTFAGLNVTSFPIHSVIAISIIIQDVLRKVSLFFLFAD